MSAPDRHADKIRNLILNHTVTDLDEIINAHDPDVDVPIKQGVWDRLDKMAMLIEAKAIARAEAAEAERDAALGENARLREAGQAVVNEFPVAAGTAKGIPPDECGYGSIYRLRLALDKGEG